MSSKSGDCRKAEKALNKAWKDVTEFIERFGNDVVSHAPVGEQRAFIRSCRMVIENCPGNLSWMTEKKPEYWPAELLFADPNNDKKNKSALMEIVKFLVGQAKMRMCSTEVKSREPESSLVTSRHQDSVEQYKDWDMKEQYKRIKGHLLSNSLELDGQLKNKLLVIVETWPVTKAWELDQLINKLKLCEKNSQLAEQFRRDLLAFADTETSALSTMSASVHAPSCEGERQEDPFIALISDAEKSAQSTMSASVHAPSREGKLQGDPFDGNMCDDEILEESKSDKTEIERSDCSMSDIWHPTPESVRDDSVQPMELNLQEDADDQQFLSNSVECPTDIDGYWECINSSLCLNIVEGTTTEKQTHNPGGHEEIDGCEPCEAVQKVLEEVFFESCMEKSSHGPDDAAECLNDLQTFIEEELKMPDVPQVPLNADYKDIVGVRAYQENFDTLKLDSQPDNVIVGAILALMQRDYPDVEVFPLLHYEEQLNYRLVKAGSEWKRWLLVPVLHGKHWLLLAADNQEKKMFILDSLPNEHLASELASWFKALMFRYTSNGGGEWEKLELPCGRQNDANSSGYFLLMNAEAFVNRESRNITPDLFRRCLVPEFREWIIWKLTYANSSRNFFHHLGLQVSPGEILCHICREMHRVAFLRVKKPNIT